MRVRDLMQLLSDLDQELEVYVEQEPHTTTKTKGVYLVNTPVKAVDIPSKCVVVETYPKRN